ncbi:universal stress protein [Goodfellowiella coeruleoviolacea]|uniref:Nucleotide-binding universal stress protein, UspA family n=1 Tax=Goodfellowiella coeruleoviolacea TaxID=334858 RepID=A0AAE3GI53_9PSEU|nr:universal stress protein [Goodfellowiella coeruleoviolacea]MCP2167759.1 Nucleotide-binding universal stress protein, UspA family [Goodfellowiella coeruleoviolacea]
MSTQDGYRIVVGVDGSPPSKAALRWALWQAGLTRGAVNAVMAWDEPPIYGWELPPELSPKRTTARKLADTVAEVAAGGDAGAVHRTVVHGNPARALVDESEDADLLVVGSRGHGGFTGALLGSVSQQCIQHARCPVVVIRQPQP